MMQPWMVSIIVSLFAAVPAAAEAIPNSSTFSGGHSVPTIAQVSPQSKPAAQAWELIRTARHNAANGQVAQATADLLQAEQLTALLSNSATLDQLFATIAAEFAKLGQYDQAIAVTNRMSYTSLPPLGCCVPVRTDAEVAIVRAYLNAGQIKTAQQFAERIQFAPSRDQALIPVVSYLAEQGQFSEAIALSQSIQNYGDQARDVILKSYINADRFTDAFAFVEKITDPNEKSSLLSTLARWAWRSGKTDLSYQIASQIPEPSSRVQLWTEVALAYARAGAKERAVSILSEAYELAKIQPEPQVFAQWAGYFAQVGAFDRALALANSFTGYEQAHAKVIIARAYSDLGRYTEAIAITQQVPDGILQPFGDMLDLKAEALQQVVRQVAKTKQYDRAMQAANVLQGQARVKALRTIAQQYRRVNRPQDAIAMLDQALAVARSVDRITIFYDRNTYVTVSNAGLLLEITQDYLAFNQSDQARAVLNEALESAKTLKVQNQDSVREQVQYLETIARLYAQLQQHERVQAAAEGAFNLINQFPGSERSSSFPFWTVVPMAEVAQMFFLAGDKEEAMQMLSSLRTVNSTATDPLQQLRGMEAIVKAYATIGAEPQMQETAEAALTLTRTLNPAQQDWMIGHIAVAAASSDPAYALQIIQNQPQQAGYVSTLAQMAVNYHAADQDTQAQAVVIQLQQIAETIPDDNQREQALNDAVRFYFVLSGVRNPSISQLLQAGQINAELQSPNLKAYNWFLIAQAYAFQGETNRANQAAQFSRETVTTMRDRFEQRELLWQMVEEALGAEEPALAAQIAMGFNEESYRTTALR
ncbi:tetratricopeptide repeat protein [Phormidium sp. FACHB-592]|uniref:Tetratricopeptide repeat protein n=1 Tax=Stenomitos frigidus AS-A4 TaxID=2933935 RepID=A0ABV0KQL4_9CYAN|nr:tetratricopeptide repeat protein [Phormidium sp. FACHB-592]MBD2072554.1 tetratricopeptide repeat protein [Phormidium sp. FACHB-592]